MCELRMCNPISSLVGRGKISPEDVRELRGSVFSDGVVSSQEAVMLIAAENACHDKCGEWREFFLEALTDFVVHQAKPAGLVSDANADWLIRTVSYNGIIDNEAEFELVVKVIETANIVPEQLTMFALEQVRHAVSKGRGAVAKRAGFVPGALGKAEVDWLRRIIYGFGGSGQVAVTSSEADFLFGLNDRTIGADNHPDWAKLFVMAIGSNLMDTCGHPGAGFQKAKTRADWFAQEDNDAVGFFANMFSGGLRAAWVDNNLFGQSLIADVEDSAKHTNLVQEERRRRANQIDADEAAWLVSQIARDQNVTENEVALLRFIASESKMIDSEIKSLIANVA